jgi:hypothetical protein
MLKSTVLSLSAFAFAAACSQPAQTSVIPVINQLELAQTHVIPPQGKSWEGEKLANYNLHLVGNRQALVLLSFDPSQTIEKPVLEALVAGQKIGETALDLPSTLAKTESSGTSYSSTAYSARLEKTWVRPGLELRVRAGTQFSLPQAVRVGVPSEFTIYTLPFYLFGLNETAVPLAQTATVNQATKDEYFAKHPIANLQIQNHAAQKVVWSYIVVGPREGRTAQKVLYKEQQGDGFAVMSAILNTLGAIRNANGDESLSNHYYAPLLMANQAGQYSSPGGGLGGGNLGTGDYAYAGIFVHEAGHAFGMPHANDGYVAGNYPYVGGSLKGSNWGFDQLKNLFLAPIVPNSASTFKNCATDGFPMGRQFDNQNRCIKQDPMQSGAGDQAAGDKYTMFSDFNASLVQQYFEGTTTVSNSQHVYNGGRVFTNPNSATGYSRWDSLDSSFVPVEAKTTNKGLYGFDNGLPITRDVPVRSLVMTANIASIADTFSEIAGQAKLSYQDTITYNPEATQIYEPVSYTGNLRRLIDPRNSVELASIVPNTSPNPWYCVNSGCDYSLKITFKDSSEQWIVLQTGFRGWFSPDINPDAANPLKSQSYRTWGVNISAAKELAKLELLETPEVWKGLPVTPKVVAARVFN